MLFVTLKAAGSRYALPAREVLEIIPLVRIVKLPGSPDYVAGLMNYRGERLPVVDLGRLLADRPSRPWASTRILVARDASGLTAGFMAERVVKTLNIDPARLETPGAPAAPYVRAVAPNPDGEDLVQVLDLSRVIPPELAESLGAKREAAWTS